jgi:hypothetical protein
MSIYLKKELLGSQKIHLILKSLQFSLSALISKLLLVVGSVMSNILSLDSSQSQDQISFNDFGLALVLLIIFISFYIILCSVVG